MWVFNMAIVEINKDELNKGRVPILYLLFSDKGEEDDLEIFVEPDKKLFRGNSREERDLRNLFIVKGRSGPCYLEKGESGFVLYGYNSLSSPEERLFYLKDANLRDLKKYLWHHYKIKLILN